MSRLMALKVKVATALTRPGVGRVVGALLGDRIPIRGCVIDTHAPGIQPEIKAMLLFRLYESAEIRFVQRYLRGDLDVVELGGCLGVVSSQIAKRLRPGRRLLTVEANPRLLDVIRKNVRANAPGTALTVVHAAIDYGSEAAETSFAFGDVSIDSTLASASDLRPTTRVPRTTLARLLADHDVGEYVLVSDVEGAEAGLLARDGAALARCRQVVIELHPATFDGRSVSVDELAEGFARLGFERVDAYGPVHVFGRA